MGQKRRLQQQLREHEDEIKKLQGLLGEKTKEVEEGKKGLEAAAEENKSLRNQLEMMEQVLSAHNTFLPVSLPEAQRTPLPSP